MKQSIRNFRKQKVVGTLNIASLALGVMVALVIGLWALNELTYDNFHPNADRKYRLAVEGIYHGEQARAIVAYSPLGQDVDDAIPEVEDFTRVVILEDEGINVEDKGYLHNRVLVADANFFSFFNFPLKTGDPADFGAPGKAILDERTAGMLFGDEDPMGRSIFFASEGLTFSVAGIMYDMPQNSHLKAGAIFPICGRYDNLSYNGWNTFNTYFQISEGADIEAIEKQITAIQNGNAKFMESFEARGVLEPLTDIHFTETMISEHAVKGDKKLVMTFIFVGLVILVISCMNFTNLFVSTSFIRAKAIGIMKSQGASKANLVLDFFRETLMYVSIALTAGVALAYLVLPVFNSSVDANVRIDFLSPSLYLVLGALAVFIVLAAGTFPAFHLTRFNVVETLGGKFRGRRISGFQKALTIIQFTASIFILLVVFFFSRQIDYMVTRDLGFDKENVISFRSIYPFANQYESFREEVMKEPSITDITAKQTRMPYNSGNVMQVRTQDNPEESMIELCGVMPNFFDFMGMRIVEGENPLYLESAWEQKLVVVNQSAVRALGLEDPIDREILVYDMGNAHQGLVRCTIKGVVADAQFASFHRAVQPQIYSNMWEITGSPMFFKISGNPRKAISMVEEKWNLMIPDIPFEYTFLDDDYRRLYIAEMNARDIMGYALVVTFVITLAGLFAMSYYSAQRRIKEIGIRKINGATVGDLLLLLNREVVIWVGIAFLAAYPATYFFMRNWMSAYSVRTPLSFWIFISGGLTVCLVALLTVSYQTWKTASANPVDSLKSE